MVNKMSNFTDEESSNSDYNVEKFIRPKRVRRPINDDSADLLGNFDDEKRKEILEGIFRNPSDGEGTSEAESDNSDSTNENANDYQGNNEINTNLTNDQFTSLLRGAAKTNRHVLYVTNLNFETTKEHLETHFSQAGAVKSIRIPKKRRGGFAFVEMNDLISFQQGFQLHNTELQGRNIKVQFSEAGKKKSANKKNILKQKNRKLAEMRNEQKTFTKSGKFYDKTLKKEKAKEMLARKRWRKNPVKFDDGRR